MRWIVDGNNVFGSRPDGWWNDRDAAAGRLAQRVAEWCRSHDDTVILVFDAPVSDAVLGLGGGNLRIEQARRRGRDGADDHIVLLIDELSDDETSDDETSDDELGDDELTDELTDVIAVVTSDRGLRRRLPNSVRVVGVGSFRDRIGG